jgi:hypothetical protein
MLLDLMTINYILSFIGKEIYYSINNKIYLRYKKEYLPITFNSINKIIIKTPILRLYKNIRIEKKNNFIIINKFVNNKLVLCLKTTKNKDNILLMKVEVFIQNLLKYNYNRSKCIYDELMYIVL